MSAYIGYLYCAIANLIVLVGDYYMKTAADRGLSMASWQFLLGCLLYGGSAVFWYLTMRHITLAQLGVAFSVFSLLSLCALGVFVFGEDLHLREYVGIGLAVLSLILMARIV